MDNATIIKRGQEVLANKKELDEVYVNPNGHVFTRKELAENSGFDAEKITTVTRKSKASEKKSAGKKSAGKGSAETKSTEKKDAETKGEEKGSKK